MKGSSINLAKDARVWSEGCISYAFIQCTTCYRPSIQCEEDRMGWFLCEARGGMSCSTQPIPPGSMRLVYSKKLKTTAAGGRGLNTTRGAAARRRVFSLC